MVGRLERDFQPTVIEAVEAMLPGCIILKNDSSYMQGVPDLLILWEDMWATLEVKPSWGAPYRPNQEYYIDLMNRMSFSAMICPENMGEVLHALQQSFRARRAPRFSQR